MKKPQFNLAAIERVDATPLRKALEVYQKALSEIEKAKTRKIDLDKEVADWLENTDPDDEKRVQMIAGRKIQAEILPNLIKRVEDQIEEKLAPALATEIDKFQGGLCRFYRQAEDGIASQIAEIIRPFFARPLIVVGDKVDRARDIALRSDDCVDVRERISRVESLRLPSNGRDAVSAKYWDEAAINIATSLLKFAEQS